MIISFYRSQQLQIELLMLSVNIARIYFMIEQINIKYFMALKIFKKWHVFWNLSIVPRPVCCDVLHARWNTVRKWDGTAEWSKSDTKIRMNSKSAFFSSEKLSAFCSKIFQIQKYCLNI